MRNKRSGGKLFAFQQKIGLTLLDVAAILLCLTVLRLANDMYQGSDGWRRTLGPNYDFSWENKDIHILYIGQARAENMPDETRDDICDLSCQGQTLADSYYLLRRADRRYELSEVYLTLKSGKTEENAGIGAGEDNEAVYMRKILEYCNQRDIAVFTSGVPAEK